MERNSDSIVGGGMTRAWRKPHLQELGNLRDFVRTGNAFGKSITTTDGDSMAGNESMPQMN